MNVFSDRFDAEDAREGPGAMLTMLSLAALCSGLTWWGWPPSLGGASAGTLLGIGLGASLALLFLVFFAFSAHHLLGAMGIRRVDARVQAEDRRLGWRIEFDTEERLGDVRVNLKVSRETFRCRRVRREIPKTAIGRRQKAGRSCEMVPEWSSDGPVVLLERALGTFVLPSSKVLQGSLDIAKPLPHPWTASASHPSRGETTRAQALVAFPTHDPVGRELFAAETAAVDADGNETIAVRLQVAWRVDVLAERPGWPDAGISLLLKDEG